jgi:hypothetical protein
MTYNYFNELCSSFKKCALSRAREPVNSSYLGKRVMEKVGQRNIFKHLWQSPYSKPFKVGGRITSDWVIPAAVGDAAYRGDESLVPSWALPDFMSGGGLRGRKEMERYDTGETEQYESKDIQSGMPVMKDRPVFAKRPKTEGGKGVKPTGERTGLPTEVALGLGMGSAALGNPRMYAKMVSGGLREMNPKGVVGRFGESKGTDALTGAIDEAYEPLKKKGLIALIGSVPVAARMLSHSEKGIAGAGEAGQSVRRGAEKLENTFTQLHDMMQDFDPLLRNAVEKATSGSEQVTQIVIDSAQEAQQSIGGIAQIVETLEREFPLVFQALQTAGETFESGGEHMRKGMESVGGGVQGLTDMLQSVGRTAAPVGAGALGGYVLANLLGKQAPARESERDREKREKQQHLINLLAGAGGGALGFYMKNKFGSPEAAAGPTQSNPSTTT